MKNIMEYNHSKLLPNVNYMIIPVNLIPMTVEGAIEFNEIYHWCMEQPYSQIARTESGGISLKNTRFPAWDIRCTNCCVEITLVCLYGQYRFQFRTELEKKNDHMFSGRHAFKKFKKILAKFNIDLESYKNDDGMKIKQTIEKPLIKLTYPDGMKVPYEHIHHVDFHASYPAGLANTHPEFRTVIEHLYKQRNNDEWFKAILNYSIGFMQSKYGCGAKYAHLSRDAIADNNKRVIELAQRIKAAGGVILCYNTDGFWFGNLDDYHDENEGTELGQWHYDHRDCKWRAKSAGCYEYIEDGQYYAVVRGRTAYDTIKPRENWQWGDIYREDCVPITYTFEEGVGIKYEKA